MKNILYKYSILYFLSISIFLFIGANTYSFAFYVDDQVNLLMDNKSNQRNIEEKLKELNEKISDSNEEEDVEVIKLCFVENTDKVYTNNNLEKNKVQLVNERKELEDQLKDYITEEINLEKIITNRTKEYLNENKLEYTSVIWPLKEYKEISSPFGERIHPITNEKSFHKGIDIPAPEYTDILAVDNGKVIFSGVQNGYGNVVKIKHFDGKVTVYAHNTENLVRLGDIVKKGETIAKVGTTGMSTGNHLHFETIFDDKNINPIEVVNK